jgi:hypothetical protein
VNFGGGKLNLNFLIPIVSFSYSSTSNLFALARPARPKHLPDWLVFFLLSQTLSKNNTLSSLEQCEGFCNNVLANGQACVCRIFALCYLQGVIALKNSTCYVFHNFPLVNNIYCMTFKEKLVDWMVRSKKYFISLGWWGSIFLVLWWIIKIIICIFFGVCIIV